MKDMQHNCFDFFERQRHITKEILFTFEVGFFDLRQLVLLHLQLPEDLQSGERPLWHLAQTVSTKVQALQFPEQKTNVIARNELKLPTATLCTSLTFPALQRPDRQRRQSCSRIA